ncbi:MAG: hypothetical protein AAF637_15185 [Pseudomonadota bacterium]
MRFGRLPTGLAGMLTWLSASAALACSTVALGLPERPIVAYSFDFAATGAGMVFVNPAGAARSSIMEGVPAQWNIRYGSITFNQLGPDMPAAGMNTAGLVVSLMWNDDAVYDVGGGAPVVNELEFIQRLLDTSGSVDEALATLQDIRIRGIVPIHFFLADRAGATAAVTPTAAGFLTHTGNDMPFPALTNSSYAELIEQAAIFEGFGGDHAVPSGDGLEDPSSLERFVMAAAASRRTSSSMIADQAFDVLDNVANASTRWQIVFDPALQEIAFRIEGQERIHRIDMPQIDFRCRERPLSTELGRISREGFPAALAPVDPARVGGVSREVLASFPKTVGLGPDLADGLTAGLLASVTCVP